MLPTRGPETAVLLALLLGCAADADNGVIRTCVIENPPADPFDLGDTESGRASPAPEPGGEPIIPPPLTVADIAQGCRDAGGSNCDERSFISRDAADCIARETGLAAGVRPWSTSLGYFENHERVCWSIMTVREYTTDGYWGESLVLDATSGAELDRGGYRATVD